MNQDETFEEPPDSTIPDKNLVDCSYECKLDDTCAFWVWSAQARSCALFAAEGTPSVLKHAYRGSKACVGKVDITQPNKAHVDGNWSPWSTLGTPCFSERTGVRTECGGGVQYRYRSCSNPHPRNGGAKCVGEDMDRYPCNNNPCPCKLVHYLVHSGVFPEVLFRCGNIGRQDDFENF